MAYNFQGDVVVARDLTVNRNLSITGTATGATPSTSDNSTNFATTAYVQNQNFITGTTLTGDVTGFGTSSFATTIATNAVTLAKMANLAANSIIGNNTGSAATPIALTKSQVQTFIGANSTGTTLDAALLGGQNGAYYLALGNATGTLGLGFGGTGLTTTTGFANKVLGGVAADGALEYKTLTQGSGVTITNTAGVITIAATGSGGTVTSVGLSAPSDFTVSNSPVTGSGTLTLARNSQSANTFLAAPNGSSGTPSYRAVVAADVPKTLDHSWISDFTSTVNATALSSFGVPTASVSMNSKNITNLADPVGAQDAATKNYVDAIKQGLNVKASVMAVSTSNITLSGTQTIDGYAAQVGDRILVAGQSTASQNGIYVVSAGAWSYATDANTSAKVTSGMFCFVEQGTNYGNNGFVLITADPITLGTTGLTFTQFTGAGEIINGTGLTKSGNTLSITSTITAGGPIGSTTTVPVITYNDQGQLTSVSSASITPTSIGAATDTLVVHLAGTETITGAKTFSTPIISSVATGTAPLTVSSTTVVTNLNADLLDSQHGTYYLALGNATGTLAATNFPALTGDITTTAGSLATNLATVNSNVGTFGSTTQVGTFTVNGKGLITAASNASITPANIGAVPTTRNVNTGTGLTGGGALSSDLTISLTKYTSAQFTATDAAWGTASGGYYTMSITAATHSRGLYPIIQIMQGTSAPWSLTTADSVSVDGSGNISIKVPSTPDCRFAGIVVVL